MTKILKLSSIVLILSLTNIPYSFAIENLSLAALAYIKKEGLPLPGQGLLIVNNFKNENGYSVKKLQIKNKGYIESQDAFIQTMIQMGDSKFVVNEQVTSNSNSTSLKRNLSDIKLSSKFQPVPSADLEKVIGFGVGGKFENNGWTDAVEFFKHKNLGVCKFNTFHILSARVNSDDISYDINHKPTSSMVEGSINHGFKYTVTWYNNDKNNLIAYDLVCATIEYDNGHINKMIDYAKNIDGAIKNENN